MHVVYVSNDAYARHLAVSAASLYDRNRDEEELQVWVLSAGISPESRKKLEQIAGAYGREIRVLELGEIRDRFDYDVDTGGFDISTMGRLFIGQILPETVKRVLYLDCDTVVSGSLKPLWTAPLQGHVLAAVMEPTIYETVKQEIGLGPEEPYFNAGVLLVDLEAWRREDVQGQLLRFYREKGGKLFACDQDAINGVLKGRILPLPPRYNFFTNYRYYRYGDLLRHAPWYEAVTAEAFRTAKRHPAILHFCGDERPWIAGNLGHYRKIYESYLARTPWAGTPKETGKELYMLLYHLMDYVTAVCPAARWEISRRFGMGVIENRKQKAEAEKEPASAGPAAGNAGADAAVLLAAYNGAAYIRQQLDSILSQSAGPLRILISDDGSSDGTAEILEEYRKRYPDRIFLAPRPHGKAGSVPGAAGNFFWLMEQGLRLQPKVRYFFFCDQDDVWKKDKAEKLLKALSSMEAQYGEETPLLVHSDMAVADSDLRILHPSFYGYQRYRKGRTSLAEVLAENPVTGGAAAVNRALARKAQHVPEACVMHDWWLALTAACFGNIGWVDEPLSLYRQHGNNVLGARRTGGKEDLERRLRHPETARENYRKMYAQARAFYRMYGKEMSEENRGVLRAYLALPAQSSAGRLRNIVRNRFSKSSLLQTLAQAVTMPRPEETCGQKELAARSVERRQPDGGPEPKICCVILNYNDAESTAAMAARIHDYRCLARIIVVDNASADDSWQRLKALEDGRVTVIRAERNGGYGAGNNLGVRWAVEKEGATHILIANPDVYVSERCIRKLARLFAGHPDLGAASAVMEDRAYGKEKNGWRLYGFWGELLAMGPVSRRVFQKFLRYPESYFRGKKAVYVDRVHGSLLMVSAQAFLDCGGYDEGLFLYQEEAVLAQRLKTGGFRTALLLNDSYRHEHAASISKTYAGMKERQHLRDTSVLYYMKEYLHIGPVRERIARLWFGAIDLEIMAWEVLRRGFSKNL